MKKLSLGLLLCAFLAAQPPLPRPAPAMNLLVPCQGKPTLLAFVVTSCPHCQAFTRDVMEPMYQAGRVCALAVAFNEDADIVRFVQDQKLTFPVYRLDRKPVCEFLGLTGADRRMGTPQVVVIDKSGVIRAQSIAAGSPLLLQPGVINEIVEKLR